MEPFYADVPASTAFGERRMKQGHKLSRPEHYSSADNLFFISCECGWRTLPFLEEDREREEYRAWKHRTEPMLLVAGSSDIMPSVRQLQVEEFLTKYGR